MMSAYHHRQQTPFRFKTESSDDANEVDDMKIEGVDKETNKLCKAKEVRGNVLMPEGIKADSTSGMAVDPPGIALVASSSSSLSSTSPMSHADFGGKTIPSRIDHLGQQHHHGHQSFHASLQHAHTHPGAPCSNPRGMVLASPGPKTPPSLTQAGSRVRRNASASPPRLYRVTSVSSSRSNRSRFTWSPFAADRRFTDQQLQQIEEQRQLRSTMYHPNYCCYPPLQHPYQQLPISPEPYVLSGYRCAPQIVGHPALRIYKLALPAEYLPLLETIVEGCEAYAQKRATGWRTDLYSLTQQDVALMDIPDTMKIAMPIMQYLSRCICEVYHANSVRVDRNQPHVLKYNDDHTGVGLHHDRCDVTANLMMSRSHTYVGGGTYFPDANRVVRLKFGEFLLHPGQLIHSGRNISAGNRYLMVLFANLK